MAYVAVNELRCKTREPIGKNAVIAFFPVLDEKTWNAVNVSLPAAVGHLEKPVIYDETDKILYREGDLPVSIPLGHKIWGSARGYNDSAYTLSLRQTIHIIDPDGHVAGGKAYTFDIAPGYFIEISMTSVTLDMAGLWKLYVKLEAV
ncbi:unnamed protein product [marine sediment metagenome]|uniref:Uncharacterized protein n=1 Tax=marine sediment metagenome TaxID=412755 RepID=X1MMW3_9ZZZZ